MIQITIKRESLVQLRIYLSFGKEINSSYWFLNKKHFDSPLSQCWRKKGLNEMTSEIMELILVFLKVLVMMIMCLIKRADVRSNSKLYNNNNVTASFWDNLNPTVCFIWEAFLIKSNIKNVTRKDNISSCVLTENLEIFFSLCFGNLSLLTMSIAYMSLVLKKWQWYKRLLLCITVGIGAYMVRR